MSAKSPRSPFREGEPIQRQGSGGNNGLSARNNGEGQSTVGRTEYENRRSAVRRQMTRKPSERQPVMGGMGTVLSLRRQKTVAADGARKKGSRRQSDLKIGGQIQTIHKQEEDDQISCFSEQVRATFKNEWLQEFEKTCRKSRRQRNRSIDLVKVDASADNRPANNILKTKVIIEALEVRVGKLIEDSHPFLHNMHTCRDAKDSGDGSSSESSLEIRSADENDALLLLKNFYRKNKFDTSVRIQQFQRDYAKKRMQKVNTFLRRESWQRTVLRCLLCKICRKRNRSSRRDLVQPAEKKDDLHGSKNSNSQSALHERPLTPDKKGSDQKIGSLKKRPGSNSQNRKSNHNDGMLSFEKDLFEEPSQQEQLEPDHFGGQLARSQLTEFQSAKTKSTKSSADYREKFRREKEQLSNRDYLNRAYIQHMNKQKAYARIKKMKNAQEMMQSFRQIESEESSSLSSSSTDQEKDSENTNFFIRNYLAPLMIEPESRRLKNFDILCSLVLFVDIFMTSFLFGNYQFFFGEVDEFLNHAVVFTIIVLIQSSHIILNFFRVQIIEIEKVRDPVITWELYLKGHFITDVVSTFPWSVINRKLILLRLLKLRRFQENQNLLNSTVGDMLPSFLNQEQQKILVQTFRMAVVVSCSMHFFACLWIFVGVLQLRRVNDGWVRRTIDDGIQEADFFSLYISSVYWVFTSFSTIGYGDIKGYTKMEMILQIVVTMIGICLFSWMSGIIQAIFDGFKKRDLIEEGQEYIDDWLFQVDKARAQLLPKAIINMVRDFYIKKFKYDQTVIRKGEFFYQLKPRLKKAVLEIVQAPLRQRFHHIIGDFDPQFQRDILSAATFLYLPAIDQTDQFYDDLEALMVNRLKYNYNQLIHKLFDQKLDLWFQNSKMHLPCLIEAKTRPKYVHFVIEGRVHIMNQNGHYAYGVLEEGSMFGEFTVLTKNKSQFSYFFNHLDQKPLVLLSIKAADFLQICNKHPLVKDALIRRGRKKLQLLHLYKKKSLIKMMKYIAKNGDCLHEFNHTLGDRGTSLVKRVLKFGVCEKKIELIKLLLENYRLRKADTHKDTFSNKIVENKIKEQMFSKMLDINKLKNQAKIQINDQDHVSQNEDQEVEESEVNQIDGLGEQHRQFSGIPEPMAPTSRISKTPQPPSEFPKGILGSASTLPPKTEDQNAPTHGEELLSTQFNQINSEENFVRTGTLNSDMRSKPANTAKYPQQQPQRMPFIQNRLRQMNPMKQEDAGELKIRPPESSRPSQKKTLQKKSNPSIMSFQSSKGSVPDAGKNFNARWSKAHQQTGGPPLDRESRPFIRQSQSVQAEDYEYDDKNMIAESQMPGLASQNIEFSSFQTQKDYADEFKFDNTKSEAARRSSDPARVKATKMGGPRPELHTKKNAMTEQKKVEPATQMKFIAEEQKSFETSNVAEGGRQEAQTEKTTSPATREQAASIRELLNQNRPKYQEQLEQQRRRNSKKEGFLDTFKSAIKGIGTKESKLAKAGHESKLFQFCSKDLIENIPEKMRENDDAIRLGLREYLDIRKEELQEKKQQFGLRELINQKLQKTKNLQYDVIQMKPSSEINHLDEVIDEYLDLEYFAELNLQRLARGRRSDYVAYDVGSMYWSTGQKLQYMKVLHESLGRQLTDALRDSFWGLDETLRFLYDKEIIEAIETTEEHSKQKQEIIKQIIEISIQLIHGQQTLNRTLRKINVALAKLEEKLKEKEKRGGGGKENLQQLFGCLSQDYQDQLLEGIIENQRKKVLNSKRSDGTDASSKITQNY